MIQFKKIPLGKSAILLLLFFTTTTTGFLQNNEDEHRTTKNDGNVRETLLSMDRREENVQAQNLPIRKLDIDRQINEKDSIAERLYDRRSFRTGTIERSLDRRQNFQIRDTTRASRDVRDINNNRREITRSNDRRTSASNLRHNQVRENRRVSERAVISRNRHFEEERRLSNIRTDRRVIERRVVAYHRVPSNRLASESIIGSRNTQDNVRDRDVRDAQSHMNVRQTRDQLRRTSDLQRRPVDLTQQNVRLGERQEVLNRQVEARVVRNRELDRRFAERGIQSRSTREDNSHNRMRSRAVLNRDVQARSVEVRQVTVRSAEDKNRRLSSIDQIRSQDTRRSTERNSRDYSRNFFENRASNMANRQRNVERREENVMRQTRARIIREQSESQHSTGRNRISEKRNIDRALPLEDRRYSARSMDIQGRRSSLVRAEDRSPTLDRQRSTNHDQMPAINRVDRHSRLLDRRISREDTKSNSLQRRDVDRRQQRSVDRREDRSRVRDESRSDSTRNIRDNVQFRRDRISKGDSRLSRENQRKNSYNKQRQSVSPKNEIISDRYSQLTADSRRYFERLVSQRTTTNTERPALQTARNVGDLKMKVDSNIWANTAKILLAAFLIGQIFVNSSKQNKFRFQNIMSMATFAKEKIE